MQIPVNGDTVPKSVVCVSCIFSLCSHVKILVYCLLYHLLCAVGQISL